MKSAEIILSIWAHLRSLRPRGRVAAYYIVFVVIACVAGPWVLPYGHAHIDLHHRFLSPISAGHPLGTDEIGRDLLTRVLMGGRVSLLVGLASTILSTVIGTTLGLVAGYNSGAARFLITTIIDATLCFPVVFLMLTLAAVLSPGVGTIIGIVTLVSWMEAARVVQAQTRVIRKMDYVTAVVAMGATDRYVLMREVLPNVAPAVIVSATLTIARAILLESYVSYLGYGVQPPDASWGNLLNNAQEYLESDPWLAIIPGVAIALTVTMFNLLGESLQDAIDPSIQAKGRRS
ncbi:ABC transporter permease [Acetobacter sacchari]|uniref:ABC transporter permease n=1 Tax=Acetobacter sacchari TaxID=2661687 RepID=A0ABS3LRM0_9PROT|nr:ABC transporter permease [Acetobacter sacchari]MBO1358546.1 ABC transporter permease [Acetobacter sacchari]